MLQRNESIEMNAEGADTNWTSTCGDYTTHTPRITLIQDARDQGFLYLLNLRPPLSGESFM